MVVVVIGYTHFVLFNVLIFFLNVKLSGNKFIVVSCFLQDPSGAEEAGIQSPIGM